MLKKLQFALLNLINTCPLLLSCLAGIMLTLCFAPFEQAYLLLPSFWLILYILEQQIIAKRAVRYSLAFSYCYFLTSCYWITHSLLVDVDRFWWLMPPSLLGIPLALSLYLLPCFISFYYAKKHELPLALIGFVLAWTIAELVRSYLLIPFPWNLLGYITNSNLYLRQLNSLGGVEVSSMLLISLVAFSYYGIRRKNKIILGTNLLAILLIFTYGILRVEATTYHDFTFNLLQVSTGDDQIIEGQEMPRSRAKTRLATLHELSQKKPANLTIWPEAELRVLAEPVKIDYDNWQHLPELTAGSYLITGAVTFAEPKRYTETWNSLYLLQDRKIKSRYDKTILTPFGEYIPFPFNLLPIPIVTNFDISAGKGYQLFVTDHYKFLPLICYEVIFPQFVRQAAREQELDYLVNISNDSWFGNTTGPYQHLAIAQVRASEIGTPILRGANHGITAVIDAYGHIEQQIPLNGHGVIHKQLPRALTPTIYTKWGEYIYYSLLILLLTIFAWRLWVFHKIVKV